MLCADRTFRLALFVVATLSQLGCVSARSQQATPAGELRIAIPYDPAGLNPILTRDDVQNSVESLLFDDLLTLDARHRLVPDLAEVVPTVANGGISRDGLSITYHLRRDAVWQDGTPFTSRDVAFTWQAIMSRVNRVSSRDGYDRILRIDTPDPHIVVVRMKAAFPPAVSMLFSDGGDEVYRILPQHLLGRYRDLNQVAFNSHPIGTGPFVFVKWLRGDRIELRANPRYFRGAPHVAKVTILSVADAGTAAALLRTGAVDLAIELTPSAYHELAGASGLRLIDAQAPLYASILFNTRRPPLDDARVRRALVEGLDRDAIARNDTHGTGTPAIADLSPFYWAFDSSITPVPFDRNLAKKALERAGWSLRGGARLSKDGRPLSLQLVFGRGPLASTIALDVQQQLRAIGVDVRLKSYEYGILHASAGDGGILAGGKYDMAVNGTLGGVDPDNAADWSCFSSPPSGDNFSRYCSAEMDQLQREALATFDQPARKKTYARIEALLLRDCPSAFLFYQGRRYAVSRRLKGFAPNGLSEGWNAASWSIADD